MARYKVGGLSVKDITSMSKQDIKKLSTQEIKDLTSRLVSAMNKRIKRLGQTEVGKLSPTYQRYEKKGKYSVKDVKDKTSAINLFMRLKDSLSSDVTTLKGWKKHREEIFNQLGTDFKGDIETEKKFWELYRKYQEQDKAYKNNKQNRKVISDQVLTYIANEIGTDFTDSEENFNKIKNKINELYEQVKGVEASEEKETGVSQFFTDGGNV